jgi:ureidoacrylate peracid hydrolase
VEAETDEQRRRLILAGLVAVPLVTTSALAADRKPNRGSSRILKFDAKPEPVAIDTATTAVMVVDMQNDFGSKGGMFDLAGRDISGIQKAVAPTARVVAAARTAGIKIVYLKMAFRPDLSDLGAPDSVNRAQHLAMNVGKTIRAPNGAESRILIRDTWNTDIVSALKPESDDIVMYKHRFSGFYETALDSTLKQHGIRYLVVTGCTTSVCVESTVRDAMFRDYKCVLLTDCMTQPTLPSSLPGTSHDASLVVIQATFGWVSSSDRFVAALSA